MKCEPYTVNVLISRLLEEFPSADPFKTAVWGDFVIEKRRIARFAEQGTLLSYPVFLGGRGTKKLHEQRVAYLWLHGWSDAIELDVGIPSLNYYICYPVQDGNHRLAAAIMRKQPTIRASCAGEVALIETLVKKGRL